MKITYMRIDDIIPYERNVKIHTEEQIEKIKLSIEQFGFNDPIALWKNNQVIEGHGRLIACKELGFEKVPVIFLDELTDEQRRAYMLVHNKLSQETAFDYQTLFNELSDITDIDMKPYDIVEEFDLDGIGDYPLQQNEKKKRQVTCPHCGKVFEV